MPTERRWCAGAAVLGKVYVVGGQQAGLWGCCPVVRLCVGGGGKGRFGVFVRVFGGPIFLGGGASIRALVSI